MKLLSDKAEIIYLLTKVIEKYEAETGVSITKNSNRKNYETIARVLSDISNQLPYTANTLQHDIYPVDHNPQKLEYPFRKYDITGNQIKDAYFNQIISNPRPFLVDACYIYLYGKGRKGFEADPVDHNLLASSSSTSLQNQALETAAKTEKKLKWLKKSNTILTVLAVSLSALTLLFLYKWQTVEKQWTSVKNDMKIMPYQPSQAEIDSLEGIWLCYTGSPQARFSDPHRYHLVVPNVVDIRYKNGYFTINRYGASFDHEGYAQFESPWLASVFTYVRNKQNQIESPRHSLLRLDKEKTFLSVISASWSFDVGDKNNIIGIREVYVKHGKSGDIEEVINTVENAGCKCKIIKWYKENGEVQVFQLKNQPLDDLPEAALRDLLDEKSILLRVPAEGMLLRDSI
jgi:hypothetical protein